MQKTQKTEERQSFYTGQMDSKLILVVIGVIAMVLGRSEAITCYECNSATESKCLDPFKSDGVKTCQGETCSKGKTALSGNAVVIRGCLPTAAAGNQCSEVSTPVGKGTSCVCNTDNCNDGQMVKPTIYNVVIGAAIATVTAVAWMNKI